MLELGLGLEWGLWSGLEISMGYETPGKFLAMLQMTIRFISA